ncbi:MAG: ATP-dependent zinc protease [Flavobacteriales bacterium]
MAKSNSEKQKHTRTIGRREFVDLPLLEARHIEAKVDTGAYRTALHCLSCSVETNGASAILVAVFDLDGLGPKTFRFSAFVQRQVRSSFGETEMRYCIPTIVKIGRHRIKSEVSLTDRSDMRYQVLIGRRTLYKKFKVDVSKWHLLEKKQS